MANSNDRTNKAARAEQAFSETTFVAPVVAGGSVRARVGGLVQTFQPSPADFNGWGLFCATNSRTAELVAEAPLPLVGQYLRLFPALRVILAVALPDNTFLAYPAHESDMRDRWNYVRPIVVRWVEGGGAFETVMAHDAGGTWWCDDTARFVDPTVSERVHVCMRDALLPNALTFPGFTPEVVATYELGAQYDDRFLQARPEEAEALWRVDQRRWVEEHDVNRTPRIGDEASFRRSLLTGGGTLQEYLDRGAYWLATWRTADGEVHTSAIGKDDLTVVSSGICLSGRGRDFDLQSLVGVTDRRDDDR
jgi:hypothetical protein